MIHFNFTLPSVPGWLYPQQLWKSDPVSCSYRPICLFAVPPLHRRYPDTTVPLFGSAVRCWVWDAGRYLEHSLHGKCHNMRRMGIHQYMKSHTCSVYTYLDSACLYWYRQNFYKSITTVTFVFLPCVLNNKCLLCTDIWTYNKEQKVNGPNPLYELAQDVALHN